VDPGAPPLADCVTVLRRVHRFGGGIAALADAVRHGDPDAVLAVLRAPHPDVLWLPHDAATAEESAVAPVREAAVHAGAELIRLARAGDAPAALRALGAFRLLCPHRRGPHGVDTWGDRAEGWLREGGPGPLTGRWYPGRPLLVTENDHVLRLFNGDTGVVVRRDSGPVAAFDRAGEVIELAPSRLGAVVPVHAMTIHKSQGSQFGTVAVVVAPPESPISTRELLYTAVTRAQRRVIVLGEEGAVRAAVERPVARASGLGVLLWGRP
jgi:exodeoxyribonuclease V alpha subunit